jgi:hypothetical protein
MRSAVVLALGLTLLLGVGPHTEATAQPAAAVSADPAVRKVTKAEWARIVAVGAWHPGCPVQRKNLRHLEINHLGFDGEVHRGVLVVRRDVAAGVTRIFTRLFDQRFPIESMRPIEEFDGNDNRSMRANNTSAYNCRRAGQANSPSSMSPHANGRAIDLNPLRNPWIDPRCDCWKPSAKYAKRTPGKGKILKGGVAYNAFVREGWIWQDIRGVDYQHFDTGYPSRPLTRR